MRLAAGGTVGYDYLVYAVGSGSADPGVPGAAEFAYPIASLEEAAAATVGTSARSTGVARGRSTSCAGSPPDSTN